MTRYGDKARTSSRSTGKAWRGLLAAALTVGTLCAVTAGTTGPAHAATDLSAAANKCLHKQTFRNFSGLRYMNDAGYGGKGSWVVTSEGV